MAEAAEAPLCDVPMLHTGELVASDAAATAHRAPPLDAGAVQPKHVDLCARSQGDGRRRDQISGFASLWLDCCWVRGGQPGRGGATDFLMQVLLESPICSYACSKRSSLTARRAGARTRMSLFSFWQERAKTDLQHPFLAALES